MLELKQAHGIGFCNITKCCTKVCPENITITDNAIIPLKERVVDEFYDPLGWLWKMLRPKGRIKAVFSQKRDPKLISNNTQIQRRVRAG